MPPLDVNVADQAALRQEVLDLRQEREEHTRPDGTRSNLPLEECANITKHIKEQTFRLNKFVSSKRQLLGWATRLCEKMHPTTHVGPNNVVAREQWVDTYKDYALQELNKCRSYVVSQIRAGVMKLMDKNFAKNNANLATLPTLEQWKRVINRGYDPDEIASESDNELFAFYVEELLSKVASNSDHWGFHKHCFECVSGAKLTDNDAAHCLPPNAEAFVLVVIEGYAHVWQRQWSMKRNDPLALIAPPRKKQGEEPSENEKLLICHCTRIDKGQKKFGGWKQEWIQKYVAYRTVITDARLTEQSGKIELRAKQILRQEADVTEPTHAAWEASVEAGKRKAVADPLVEIEDLFCDEV